MPRGDRTGPAGEGPMTGRQLGYGAGYDSPGFTKGAGMRRRLFGRARGMGFGQGFSNREMEAPPPVEAQTDSIDRLKVDVYNLQTGLSALLDRLKSVIGSEPEKKE